MAKAKGTIELEVKSDRFNSGVQNIIGKLESIKSKTGELKGAFSGLAGPASTLGGGLKSIGDGAAQASRNLNTLGGTTARNAHSSFNNMATSAGRAAKEAMALGNNSGGATPKITAMGNAAQGAGGKMGTMSAQAGKAAGSTGRFNAQTVGTAASIGTMGAGLVSLEASMSNYDKAAQKVDKAEQGLQKTRDLLQTNTIGLERAELRYEAALASGKKTEEELSLLANNRDLYRQKVATATQELTIKEQDLNIAMMDQTDTHKLMASSIATTLLGTISSAAGLMGNMNMQSLKNIKNLPILSKIIGITGTTSGAAAPKLGATSGAMSGMQGAGAKAGIGLRTVATGFKGLFLAMGPIGWAILGVTALWAAWETNFLGFRDGIHYIVDGMQAIWTWLEKILLPLQWLNEGLKQMGIDLGGNLNKWQEEEKATRAAEEAYDDTKDAVGEFGTAHGTMQTDIAADTILINQDVDSIGTHVEGIGTSGETAATGLKAALAGEGGAFNAISNDASTSLGGVSTFLDTTIPIAADKTKSELKSKFGSIETDVGTALENITTKFESESAEQKTAIDTTATSMATIITELNAIGETDAVNSLTEKWKNHAAYLGGGAKEAYDKFGRLIDDTVKKNDSLDTSVEATSIKIDAAITKVQALNMSVEDSNLAYHAGADTARVTMWKDGETVTATLTQDAIDYYVEHGWQVRTVHRDFADDDGDGDSGDGDEDNLGNGRRSPDDTDKDMRKGTSQVWSALYDIMKRKAVRMWLTKSEWSNFPYSKANVENIKQHNVQGYLNGFNQLTSLVTERIDWFNRGKHLLSEEELAKLDDMPDKDPDGVKRKTRSHESQTRRLNWDYVCKPWNSGTHNWDKNWYRIYLAGLAKERLEKLIALAKDREPVSYTHLTLPTICSV